MTSVIQAALSSIASDVQKGKKSNATKGSKGRAGRARQRMMTPEATPELDEARINADKNRIQEAASKSTEVDDAEFSTTKEPLSDAEDDNESLAVEVAQEVLKYRKNEYRKILGAKESYKDLEEEQDAFEVVLWDRTFALHPKVNTTENGAKAYQRILSAANALKIDEKEILLVMNWDGLDAADDIDEVQWKVPLPHAIIVGIYQQATLHFAQLLKDPKSEAAAKALDDLNDQIKKQNEKDDLELSDHWSTRYQDLATIYEKARPAMDRVQKNSSNEEAKIELATHYKDLVEIIEDNHYRSYEWLGIVTYSPKDEYTPWP